MEYKTIFIPSLLTGIVSGASYLLAKLPEINLYDGMKATIIGAVLTALIAGSQYFLNKYNQPAVKVSVSRCCSEKKTKLFLGQK